MTAAAMVANLAMCDARTHTDPPDAFVASPDVVAMWDRYEYFWLGGDLL
jgi:hypothetical protein